MGHKGYYGQYTGNSKFSKKHDEAYDAKEAYNKDLTASARLHYLENDRHDHNSPAKNIVDMGKKAVKAVEGYKEDARFEEMSYQMDKKKRNAAAQKHCM
jgi:hypothetical protein